METQIIKIFLALVVLVNPFAAISLFLDITRHGTLKQKRKVAGISALTVFLTIAIFSVAGEAILKVLGISVGSFRVAGGILVFLIAISMMNGSGNPAKPHTQKQDEVSGEVFNGVASAVVPLTIPMVIGPGGISTVIIYTVSAHSYTGSLMIMLAGLIISLITYSGFMMAEKIGHHLGETGLNIMNRIMGMLLAAVSIEIIVAGLRSIFPQLA